MSKSKSTDCSFSLSSFKSADVEPSSISISGSSNLNKPKKIRLSMYISINSLLKLKFFFTELLDITISSNLISRSVYFFPIFSAKELFKSLASFNCL